MPLFMVFIAIAAAGLMAVMLWPTRSKAMAPLEDAAPITGLPEPDPVLPPVMLPERPGPADVDAVRLPVALRGYRCDLTDEVLDALAARIDQLEQENSALKNSALKEQPGPTA